MYVAGTLISFNQHLTDLANGIFIRLKRDPNRVIYAGSRDRREDASLSTTQRSWARK